MRKLLLAVCVAGVLLVVGCENINGDCHTFCSDACPARSYVLKDVAIEKSAATRTCVCKKD